MTSLDRDFEQALENLNFADVTVALTAKDDGPMWSLERAEATEAWYRRFLFLAYKYPSLDLVPSKDIDVFWHNHILHTQQYVDDCDSLFGKYLHHHPRDVNERSFMTSGGGILQTEALFLRHFGESPFNQLISGTDNGSAVPCSRCGSKCSGRQPVLSLNM